MNEKPGSMLGGIFLIAGSCIGAGMLALPVITGMAGFAPSSLMFLVAWAFMTTTGLLLVEVNHWFDRRTNLISMVSHYLGPVARGIAWILYLFLFYSLLMAYVAGSGKISSNLVADFSSFQLPVWGGSVFFVILFSIVVYLGTKQVDYVNRIFMVGKILAFLGLVLLGVYYIEPQKLMRSEPSYALFSLPILIVSFGFHNMIPSLMDYMKGDTKRVKATILGGSFLALFIYLIWEVVALGCLPLEGEFGVLNSFKVGREASVALSKVLQSPAVALCAQFLGFFAILTSFLTQALSLVHFLSDGMKISYKKHENIAVCLLAILPPLVMSLVYPGLFYKALDFAGGFCAVILFGIFPVMMVWKGRKFPREKVTYQLMGGKPLLLGVLLFSLFILFYQVSSMLNASFVLKP